MGKILIGDIQGPKGDTGDQGPPGNTGSNSLFDGVQYITSDGAINYIGDTDPATLGDVPDGSVWFDTS